MGKFIIKKPWKVGTAAQEKRKLDKLLAKRDGFLKAKEAAEAAGDVRAARAADHQAVMVGHKAEHQAARLRFAERKEAIEAALKEAGATLEKKEDRWGQTKSGWWQDGVFLDDDLYRAAEHVWGFAEVERRFPTKWR